MDQDISTKLQEILSDPNAMQKVMGIAESLMGGTAQHSSQSADTSAASDSGERQEKGTDATHPPKIFSGKESDENSIRLLGALCPYLNPGRREAARSIIRIMKILQLLELQMPKGE